jgi:hypothetical protein
VLIPFRRACLIVVIALLLCPSLRAAGDGNKAKSAAPVWQLAFKFTAKQAVHYDDRFNSSIQVRKGEKSVRILNNRETRKHYRVLTVDDRGQGLVETVVDRVKIHAQKGTDPPIHVDSTADPDKCPSDFRPLLQTIGRPIARSRFGTSGKLLKVLSVSKTWLKANPGSTFTSMSKSLVNRSFLVPLPDVPVGVGAAWDEAFHVTAIDSDRQQRRIAIKRIYTLEEVADSKATITWKTVKLTPVTDRRILAQLIQVVSSGTVVFDIRRGLLISKTTRIDSTLVGPFGDDTLMTAKTTHELVLSEGD